MLLVGSYFVLDDRRHSLLHVDREAGKAVIVDAEPVFGGKPLKTPWPITVDWAPIESKKPIAAPDSNHRRMNRTSCNSKQSQAFDRLKPLIRDTKIFQSKFRGAMLRAHAIEINCSRRTLEKDLLRLFQGGMSPTSLAGRYDKCGTRENFNPIKTPGRRRLGGGEPYKMTVECELLMQAHLSERYLTDHCVTLKDAYEDFTLKNFTVIDDQNMIKLDACGERPSQRQYQYVLRKKYSKSSEIKKRAGKEFGVNFRGSSGETTHQFRGPADCYVIDHTTPSIKVVSRFNRNNEIGSPTIALIKDHETALFVGYTVTMESESWETASAALRSIGQDWVAHCKQLNIRSTKADWPAQGIYPSKILCDKSEMASAASNALPDRLDIQLVNCPPGRPDIKGTIESEFRTLDIDLHNNAPGGVSKWNSGRDPYVKRKTAEMTLDDVRRFVLNFMLQHNRSPRVRSNLQPELKLSGNLPSPIELWNTTTKLYGCMGREIPSAVIDINLMHSERGVMTAEGLLVNGLLYISESMLKEDWLSVARASRKKTTVEVRYCAINVGVLNIWVESSGKYEPAKLKESLQAFSGLSLTEYKNYKKDAGKLSALDSEVAMQHAVQAKSDSIAIAENARALTAESRRNQTEGQDLSKFDAARAEKIAERIEYARSIEIQAGETQNEKPGSSPTNELAHSTSTLPSLQSGAMYSRLKFKTDCELKI